METNVRNAFVRLHLGQLAATSSAWGRIILDNRGLLVAGAIGLTIVYYICLAVYNIYLHPLRRYPGPTICAATSLVDSYFHYVGKTHVHLKRLHDEYGPVVRIAPTELSYTDPSIWRDIYGYKPLDSKAGTVLPKHPELYFNLRPGVADLFRTNDTDHKRIRRPLQWGFASRAVEQQIPVIEKHVLDTIAALGSQAATNGIIEATIPIDSMAFDVGCDLLFGKTFPRGSGRPKDQTTITKSLQLISRIRLIFRMPRLIRPFLWLLVGAAAKSFAIEEHIANSERMTSERLAQGITGRNDVVDHFLLHNKDTVTTKELVVASRIIISGSSETTASAMSSALYYLLQHPAILQRLKDEVRSSDMTIKTLTGLPLLHAVIMETMRIMPPTPITLTRLVDQPTMICGEIVPRGTAVGVQLYAAYRSALNFEDPDTFKPDRWLEENNDNKQVFQPFSTGPRRCLAEPFAWAEMKLFVAHMVSSFDMKLMPASQDWTDAKAWLAWHKNPLYIKLRPVQR